ncbi:MAG TPA: hypothetical protein EYG52_07235 [Pseudomonadales bacterium]|nr:hypothetical protein [Gammaproteobacteria bacterium]HIL83286.1 hypothetical protein [Pseudomonadales bacterium]
MVLLSLPIRAEISNAELIVGTEQAAGAVAPEPTADAAELTVRGQSVVDEVVYAEITYQLPVSLVAGGSIVLRQQWTEGRRLQIETPASTNFVRVVTDDRSAAQLLARYVEVVGITGEPGYQASSIAFDVTSGVLPAGTILRFVIDRLQLPTRAMTHYEIPLYLKNNQQASLTRVPGNTIQIGPGDFSQLSLYSSSVATPGELVDLWVRLEDEYGNIAQAQNLSLDLLVNGVFTERLDVVTSVQKIDGISFRAAGTYQLELRTGGGGISATSNPVLVSNKPYRIIWADLGVPTEMLAGAHSAEELARNAMGRYDLTLPADHETLDDTSVVSHWQSLAAGGASLVLSKSDTASFTIAKPEQPTDLRRMVPGNLQLVEIVSGGSVYDWFGNRAAMMGFRIGFTGSNYSLQYPGRFQEVNTAIWLTEGQHWFDAMSKHQTYVSVGSKIVLAVSPMNFGLEPIRNLVLEIAAASPIVSVEVFKNGSLFKTRRQLDTGGSRFRLVVESSSEPFSRLMSRPRNAREWVGYVVAQGARITVDRVGQYWQIKPGQESRRVDFLTRTHGLDEFLEFELTSADADTVIEIGIAPGYEDVAWIPKDRLPKPTSGQKFLIPIEEAIRGGTRTFEVEGYRDSVRIEPALVPFESSMRYEFNDPSTPQLGDYYYFRVRLEDGDFAYTSPIYVGDFE